MKSPRFNFNNPSLQSAFDKIADHMDRMEVPKKIIAGENIRKVENKDEIIIHGSAEGLGGGGGAVCDCPFEVYFQLAGNESGNYECVIGHGRVNNTTTDEVTLHDNIVAGNEDDVAQFTILEVTFGSTGGISQYSITESGDIPTAHEPTETYPTSAKVVLGVRTNMKYQRIIGCHNLSLHPIRVGGNSMTTQYWTYEVLAS